jgi:hypothetical protein
MAAQQFLCSVSLYSAWLLCGGSWVVKPRKGFAKGQGSRDLGKAWLLCPAAGFRNKLISC